MIGLLEFIMGLMLLFGLAGPPPPSNMAIDLGMINPEARSVMLPSEVRGGHSFFTDGVVSTGAGSPTIPIPQSGGLKAAALPLNCGDINGDGVEDMLLVSGDFNDDGLKSILGEIVFTGFPFPSGSYAADAFFSIPIEHGDDGILRGMAFGDITGNGIGDIAVATDYNSMERRREYGAAIRIFKGSEGVSGLRIPSVTAKNVRLSDNMTAISAFGLGKINSNFRADMMIGALIYDGWSSSVSKSHLFFATNTDDLAEEEVLDIEAGKIGGHKLITIELNPSDEIRMIRTVGDVDGDSREDIGVITLKRADKTYEAFIIKGRLWQNIVPYNFRAIAIKVGEFVYDFEQQEHIQALNIKSAGDLDNDATDDFVVTVDNGSNFNLHLYLGSDKFVDGMKLGDVQALAYNVLEIN